jgi:hypothetical protein
MRTPSRRIAQRWLAGWLAFAVTVVVLFTASRARAQTVTINTGSITRETKDGASVSPRFVVDGKTPGLSQQDCLDDLYYDFPLVITGLPTQFSLQAWAGTSCTDATSRTGTNPTCWPLLASNISPAASVNVRIRMRDIVGQMTTQPKVLTYSAADKSVCTSQTTLGSGRTALNVFFLWVNGSDSSSQGTGATYALAVKLFGPDAPTGLSAGAGGGLLKLTWTAPTNQSDLTGYRIYAQATSTADGGSVDASTTTCTEAGVDDAGATIDASCTTTTLTCGGTIDPQSVTPTEVGGQVGGGTVKGLQDGVGYTVAVAGYDSFGNSGTLSASICATPQDTVDFWDNYRNSGGTAGGGCNVGGSDALSPWLLFGGFAAVLGALARRVRRTSG